MLSAFEGACAGFLAKILWQLFHHINSYPCFKYGTMGTCTDDIECPWFGLGRCRVVNSFFTPRAKDVVCGSKVQIYTGRFCATKKEYNAALTGFVEQANVQIKCWWDCMVKSNKCACAAIGAGANIVYSMVELAKLPGQVPKGGGMTTLLSQTSYWVKRIPLCKKIGHMFRMEARWIQGSLSKSGILRTGAKVAIKGAIAGEIILSIHCSCKCATR